MKAIPLLVQRAELVRTHSRVMRDQVVLDDDLPTVLNRDVSGYVLSRGTLVTEIYQANGRTAIAIDRELTSSTAIWYRRIRSPAQPDTMDPGIYDFCLRETRAALVGGLLYSIFTSRVTLEHLTELLPNAF